VIPAIKAKMVGGKKTTSRIEATVAPHPGVKVKNESQGDDDGMPDPIEEDDEAKHRISACKLNNQFTGSNCSI
jgi:hypothetical protein